MQSNAYFALSGFFQSKGMEESWVALTFMHSSNLLFSKKRTFRRFNSETSIVFKSLFLRRTVFKEVFLVKSIDESKLLPKESSLKLKFLEIFISENKFSLKNKSIRFVFFDRLIDLNWLVARLK